MAQPHELIAPWLGHASDRSGSHGYCPVLVARSPLLAHLADSAIHDETNPEDVHRGRHVRILESLDCEGDIREGQAKLEETEVLASERVRRSERVEVVERRLESRCQGIVRHGEVVERGRDARPVALPMRGERPSGTEVLQVRERFRKQAIGMISGR